MGNTKKRLAVFLSILFILPSILAVLPQTSEEVLAKTSYRIFPQGGKSESYSDDAPRLLLVEAGQQFYIGDYWEISSYDRKGRQELGTASMVKASYSSSDENVATVDGKGLVNTKSEGTANIKMKYKGETGIFEMQVVKEGSFERNESYTKVTEALAKLVKTMPSKVTSKNGFKMIKAMKAYEAVCDKVSSQISTLGFVGKNEYKLAVPQAGRFNTYQEMLYVYAQKNSPLATRSAKVLKVASVKASETKVEIKLKKAPTKEQFLSMKILYTLNPYPKKNRSAANNKVYFYLYFISKNGESQVIGLACMTKGSKTVTVMPLKGNPRKDVNGKLPKGTYRLGGYSEWTKGKEIVVR